MTARSLKWTMAFFRSVTALSRLRSRVVSILFYWFWLFFFNYISRYRIIESMFQGQQSNLSNSVRWLQMQSSSDLVISLSLSLLMWVYVCLSRLHLIRSFSLFFLWNWLCFFVRTCSYSLAFHYFLYLAILLPLYFDNDLVHCEWNLVVCSFLFLINIMLVNYLSKIIHFIHLMLVGPSFSAQGNDSRTTGLFYSLW